MAERAPAPLGTALANTAKESFISGMDLGLIVAASVAGVAGLIVLAMLPNRPRTQKNSLGRPSPHLNEPPKPGEHRTPDLSQGREPAHLAAATTYASHRLGDQDGRLRADRAAVREAIGRPGTTLVDVRSAAEYRGECFWPSGSMEPGGRGAARVAGDHDAGDQDDNQDGDEGEQAEQD